VRGFTILLVPSGKVIGCELFRRENVVKSWNARVGLLLEPKTEFQALAYSRQLSESLASQLPQLAAVVAVLKTPSHSTH